MNAKKFLKSIAPAKKNIRPGTFIILKVVRDGINKKATLNKKQQGVVEQALTTAQLCTHGDGSHWKPLQAALQITTYINSCN